MDGVCNDGPANDVLYVKGVSATLDTKLHFINERVVERERGQLIIPYSSLYIHTSYI